MMIGTKKTTDLMTELKKTEHIEDYFHGNEENLRNETFVNALTNYFEKQGRSKAEIARASGSSDIYLYQIFAGKRVPSRDRLTCICLGMHLNEDDTQYLLRLCGYAPLYARDKRDAVILHGLLHHLPLAEINNSLIDNQLGPILS